MTRYHADAYFGPRVRTCSRNAIQPLHQLRLHVRRLLPRQRTLWGVGRIRRHSAAIERYGSSEYESLLGMGRGRSSIRRRCGRKGHTSFGNLGLAGWRRSRLLTVPPALSTYSLRTSPPPAGLPSRTAWTPASRRQERPSGAQPTPGCARLRRIDLVLVVRLALGPLRGRLRGYFG